MYCTVSDDMLAQVSADARPSAAARLAIYANGYRLRLLEALDTDFSALHTLAGDELFEQIGRAYIDAHPSEHFSIRYFGQHLSAFLAQTAPYTETPVLAEMAALEWALTLAFDAADDPVLTEASLAMLPAESWPEHAAALPFIRAAPCVSLERGGTVERHRSTRRTCCARRHATAARLGDLAPRDADLFPPAG